MKQKIILSVPAEFQYLSTVENFTDILLKHFNVKEEDAKKLAQELRSTVNEAFVNVLRHTPHSKEQLVDINFNFRPPLLIIRFSDQGKGIKINGHHPPYPDEFVGTEHTILKTLDGELKGVIEKPGTLKLWFKNSPNSLQFDQLINQISDGGMGLSIIVKSMDEVRFIWDAKKGHYLEVIKKIRDIP